MGVSVKKYLVGNGLLIAKTTGQNKRGPFGEGPSCNVSLSDFAD